MEKLTRRRVLRMLGLGAAGTLAAACQPKVVEKEVTRVVEQEKVVKETVMVEGTPQVVEKVVTNTPAPAQPFELRFIKLSMAEETEDYFHDTIIPTFEEAYPNITVKVDMSDWDHLGEKLLTSFAGNIPVDLVHTGSDWVGPYAARKQFLALDDFVGGDYGDEFEDFYQDMVDISRYEGELYAMPMRLDVRSMWYRKDHFEEAGLDPEAPPETWEELVEYSTKLVKTDDSGEITRAGYLLNAGDPGGAAFEYWYRVVQNGSGFVVPWESWEPEDVAFNGPDGLEALEFVYSLINTHKVSPLAGISSKIPDLSPLGSGVVSMSIAGGWELRGWKKYQPEEVDLLGLAMPLKKKVRRQYACPNVYAIGANTEHPDGAWELMKHMVSREMLEGYLSMESLCPPRRSIAEEAAYILEEPKLQKLMEIPGQGWGTTTPQALEWPTIEIIGNYVQSALRDQMGLQAALDAAASEVKEKMIELKEE